jgi:dipeptidyl aminopeptidase/acylaminoacyl peptidase
MRYLLFSGFIFCTLSGISQKKPLDHTVYDGWESIAERQLSNDGRWVAFTVTPQEGDGRLMVMKSDGTAAVEVPRGYSVKFSPDNRFAVFLIKPTFTEARQARIKKARPDNMPKDSLGWVVLEKGEVKKVARVKNYKMPTEATWIAYQKEKPLPDTTKKPVAPKPDPKLDSAKKVIDSLQSIINQLPAKVKKKYFDEADLDVSFLETGSLAYDADEPNTGSSSNETGGDLVWLDLNSGKELVFKNIMDFSIDSIGGKKIAMETGKMGKDSLAKALVLLAYTQTGKVDTLARNLNDARNLRFDEAGQQLAFVAEMDSSAKALQKFYKLFYYKDGMAEAKLIADRSSKGKKADWAISENAPPKFSKSGKRLLFGVAPVLPLKDTSLPEFERVSLDIWHWNEDFLQPQQLRNLNRDLNRSYTAMFFTETGSLVQLADESLESLQTGLDGDLPFYLGADDRAYRVEAQWLGGGKSDIYAVDPTSANRTLVKKGLDGFAQLSANGKYIVWYDRVARHYFTWSNGQIRNISDKVKFALWDESHDTPSDPAPYGQMGWQENDEAFYIYDKFDIWKLDPMGVSNPVCITKGEGRKNSTVIRYVRLDAEEERFLKGGQKVLFSLFDNKKKTSGLKFHTMGSDFAFGGTPNTYPAAVSQIRKAKQAEVISLGVENPAQAADIRVVSAGMNDEAIKNTMQNGKPLYLPNPQQIHYNWLTTELVSWKTYNGKTTQGILYKPENFDPNKKYPLIAYFYETVTDGLYNYQAPAPTPSRLNIPFFVSRGYLVLAPDIYYKTGQPAQDAFDHIVSGVRHIVKMGIADSTRLGIQGQSWGGIQVAQLITMTPMFKAAWAGAPVANMTSAYGGIRWESGLNRQFQYEKTQSRIGATLWERPDLYLKNSPLFHLPKVTTPLVIMHNDADGAVPWYQGIELYTGLRRLQKPVWMLNYNGEAHNLVERKNRKDIQIREQQFFDWLLMDAKPPKWITKGVPALMKGRDWGLGE